MFKMVLHLWFRDWSDNDLRPEVGLGREEAWAAEALGCVEIEVMATRPLWGRPGLFHAFFIHEPWR